jgi:crossover junction endodeoxyribonuclease RuvC
MTRPASSSVRVLGIDPGLNISGYGVLELSSGSAKLVEAGVIRMPCANGNNLPLRLETLFNGMREVIEDFRPEAVCLEEVFSHTDYPRTAILMGHARGVICLAARLARLPVFHVPAKRIKQAVTGNGNASKAQVQRAVQQRLSLLRPPNPPDIADALAVALCYLNTVKAASDARLSQRMKL